MLVAAHYSSRAVPRALCPALLALVLALGLAGCGAEQTSTVADFEGEQRGVAQAVEDLQTASQEGDAARICSRLLSQELVDRLSAGGLNCTAEIDKALLDADEYELDVKRIEVRGATATAQVEDGKGRTHRIGFVRERGGWRADALATS